MKYLLYNLLLFFLLTPVQLSSRENKQEPDKKLIIGLTETPPFVVQENGDFKGLSISSWELVNQKLDRDYEYRIYPSLIELLKGIENKEVDFSINPVTVTVQRMQRLDFSQPYFISNTGVAKKTENVFWNYLFNLFSWNFISAILVLLGILFFFGFLVWIFERKKNEEEFGGGFKGILQGFWWSAVTMTTVGYGDKSPRSFGGRFIALIWMFMAVIMISSLTAGIASSLTVQSMYDEINSVQDLSRFDVVTVTGSSAQELLEQYNIPAKEVPDAGEGIRQIFDGKTSLFIYDQPILKYEIDRHGLNDELEVLPRTLKKDYYSYSFPKGSSLLKTIDPILVSTLKTMKWNTLIEDYK